MKEKLMTIAEISRTFGVSARTLRDRIHKVRWHDNVEYASQDIPGEPIRYWVTQEFVDDIVKGGKARKYHQAVSFKKKTPDGGEPLSVDLEGVSIHAEKTDGKLKVTASFDYDSVRRFADFIRSFR